MSTETARATPRETCSSPKNQSNNETQSSSPRWISTESDLRTSRESDTSTETVFATDREKTKCLYISSDIQSEAETQAFDVRPTVNVPQTPPIPRQPDKRDHNEDSSKNVNCVVGFLFPLQTYRLLQDCRWLQENVSRKRIVYELNRNRLLVNVVASSAHDAAANAWNGRIHVWSTGGGGGPLRLRQSGQGRMFHF
jgi:hypothetical protein